VWHFVFIADDLDRFDDAAYRLADKQVWAVVARAQTEELQ